MHSAEPYSRRSLNDPSQPLPQPLSGDKSAWRAEVASRVHNYRARQGGPAAEARGQDAGSPKPASPGGEKLGARNLTPGEPEPPNLNPSILDALEHPSAPRREPPSEAHKAFDTNYYRRLNAQSRNAVQMGATAPASVPARPEPESSQEADPRETDPRGTDQSAMEIEIGDALDSAWEIEGCPEAAAPPALDLDLHSAAAGDPRLDRYTISDAAPSTLLEADAEPFPDEALSGDLAPEEAPDSAAVLSSQGNLIVFPRPLLEPPLLPQPSRDELAEPVRSRPRILEVPEDIMPAVQGSLFPEIRLDADELEPCASREPAREVPLPVAPLSERLMASLIDVGVVIAAGALFAAIACYALPGVPHTKPFWMGLAGATVLLWAVYQYLFLLYAGRTVGMSLRGIHLSTFAGQPPEWAQRGRRARFVLISFVSAALGFLWALADEDTLCWHDRISQTFPTQL